MAHLFLCDSNPSPLETQFDIYALKIVGQGFNSLSFAAGLWRTCFPQFLKDFIQVRNVRRNAPTVIAFDKSVAAVLLSYLRDSI